MSKELEAFNKIISLKDELEDIVYDLPCCFDTTELDGDEIVIVEKGLIALGIIKEHGVDVAEIKICQDYVQYEAWFCENVKGRVKLTQEEFDLLKEILA